MFPFRRLPLLFAAAFATATPVSANQALDLSGIDFTETCEPNALFARVLGVFGSSGDTVDAPVLNALSGEVDREIHLDIPIAWHGLNLVGIRHYSGIERGPVNYYMRFRNTPEEVLATLNARGMNLPAVDETRDVPGLEGYAAIGVQSHAESDGNSASLTCFRD